ncbi:MAG TPA: hypothetical protein VEK07_05170 [Polyangiaceae bacterium]|nr:hypothetical protein [Polyangiaceae bacterium]
MARLAPAVAVLSCAVLAATSVAADEAPTFADRDDAAEADETERGLGFMINPLAIAAGVFGGDVDFAVLPRIALGIEGAVVQLADGSIASAVGVGLLVYPIRSRFHGLVLEPCAVYARSLREPLARFDWRANVVGFGGTLGWQWTWDYGLSLRLGVGPMRFVGGSRAPGIPIGRDGLDLVLDGSIGWLF